MQQETFRLPTLPEVLCNNESLVDTLNSLNLVSDQCLRIDVACERNDGKGGNPNRMDKRERTGCRLPENGGYFY